jgi:hypothetical protein
MSTTKPTTCDRCGHGIPLVHDLTDAERALAVHFLTEIYAGHGEPTRRSFPPYDPAEMLRYDPHYFLCQNAIRDARRLLLAFPEIAHIVSPRVQWRPCPVHPDERVAEGWDCGACLDVALGQTARP